MRNLLRFDTALAIVGNYTTVGYEEIVVHCNQRANNLTLHAQFIDIGSVQVFNLSSSQELAVSSLSNDSTTNFLIIGLSQDLTVNTIYRLTIHFVSILNDNAVKSDEFECFRNVLETI